VPKRREEETSFGVRERGVERTRVRAGGGEQGERGKGLGTSVGIHYRSSERCRGAAPPLTFLLLCSLCYLAC